MIDIAAVFASMFQLRHEKDDYFVNADGKIDMKCRHIYLTDICYFKNYRVVFSHSEIFVTREFMNCKSF